MTESLVTRVDARPADALEALRRLDLAGPVERSFEALGIVLAAPPIVARDEGGQRIRLAWRVGCGPAEASWDTRVESAGEEHVFVHTTVDAERWGAIGWLLMHFAEGMHASIREYAEDDARSRRALSAVPRATPRRGVPEERLVAQG